MLKFTKVELDTKTSLNISIPLKLRFSSQKSAVLNAVVIGPHVKTKLNSHDNDHTKIYSIRSYHKIFYSVTRKELFKSHTEGHKIKRWSSAGRHRHVSQASTKIASSQVKTPTMKKSSH